MGNKFPIVSVLLLVICLPAAAWVSHDKLSNMQEKMYSEVPDQAKRVYLPAMGFDKFYADTQWVQLVQDMGKSSASNKKMSPEDEAKQRQEKAKYFYDQFERLTDLDPNNEIYYMTGSSTLQNSLPEKAIALLQKGDQMLRNPSYKYPFNQYFIKNNVIAFNNEDLQKKMYPELSKLLKEAMDRPGAPSYIQNKWLRLEAKRKGFDDDDIGRLKLWAAYYINKSREGIKGNNDADAPGENYSDGYDTDESLRNQIMEMAQKMAVDNWKRQQSAKNDAEKKKLAAQHEAIKKEFNKIAPPGHYSSVSLMPYAPGDLYDAYTGTPVKPYGVDPELLEKGIIAIYKGPFSHITGKPRAQDVPPGPAK